MLHMHGMILTMNFLLFIFALYFSGNVSCTQSLLTVSLSLFVERYFPLAHYYFKSGTPGNIKQMHDVTSQDVKEKINDSEKV